MKICILSIYYLPHIGGVEIVTFHMAKELSLLGHEVHVITQEKVKKNITVLDSNLDNHSINNNFYVHRMSSPFQTIIDRIFEFKLSFFIIPAFLKIMKIRPDIVHVQNISSSIPAFFSKIFFNIPYTIGVHGEKYSIKGEGILLPCFFKKIWPAIPYVKHSEIIFTLTEETRQDIQNCLNKVSITIPNGVDLVFFSPVQRKSEFNPQIPKIVCISRLESGKGIECALQAMKLIAKKEPKSKLIIIGGGSIYKKLEDLTISIGISNNVEFVGEVPIFEVPNYLFSSNIYLLPSFYEGFSLSLLEAMASGLPIISTPVGIATKLIKECNNGYLVPIGDSHAIYEAVIRMIENPEIMVTFSNNSARSVQEYSWSKIIKKYEKEFLKILEHSKNLQDKNFT